MTAASSMQLTLRRLSHAAASGSGSSIWAGRQAPGGPGLAQALLQQRGLASRASPSLQRSARGLLRDLKQLSKARLSALVVLTAAAGFAAGSGDTLDWAGMAWTCAGTFGAAACANTLNQVYEIANDRRMSRTCNRPLPAGRLGRLQALAFAATMGAGGLWILAEKANPLTASLGAANILLYAACYTPLKQLSVVNTWVGAVVGAIPPLMGWAAAAGQLEPGAWVLAAALFSWQMPHFMALAWMCKDDYVRGGFRMLSMLDASGRRTAAVALRHSAYLAPIGLAATALGITSGWFAGEAAALAAVMGAGAASFYAAPSQASARQLFRGSLLYLPLLLVGLAVHRQPNTHQLSSLADVRQRVEREYGISLALPAPVAEAAAAVAGAGAGVAARAREALPSLPQVRLRSVEDRLGPYYTDLQRLSQQLGKCPSKVHADADTGAASVGSAADDGSSPSSQPADSPPSQQLR